MRYPATVVRCEECLIVALSMNGFHTCTMEWRRAMGFVFSDASVYPDGHIGFSYMAYERKLKWKDALRRWHPNRFAVA